MRTARDTNVRSGKRLLVVLGSILAVAGLVTAVLVWKQRRAAAEQFLVDYPVELDRGDVTRIAASAAAWRAVRDKLVATAKDFAKIRRVVAPSSAAPCPLALRSRDPLVDDTERDAATRSYNLISYEAQVDRRLIDDVTNEEYLPRQLADVLDTAIAGAERGRFVSVEARDAVVEVIGRDWLTVVSWTTNERPTFPDGATTFTPGYREGTAYVFARATGDLACVGAFTATSSESVAKLANHTDRAALNLDLEANTDRAIAAAVKSVR